MKWKIDEKTHIYTRLAIFHVKYERSVKTQKSLSHVIYKDKKFRRLWNLPSKVKGENICLDNTNMFPSLVCIIWNGRKFEEVLKLIILKLLDFLFLETNSNSSKMAIIIMKFNLFYECCCVVSMPSLIYILLY